MKGNHRLINLLLFISRISAITLTASSYVGCISFEKDEFLDLSLSSQIPLLPVLIFPRKATPHPLYFLRVLLLFEPDLYNECLRW